MAESEESRPWAQWMRWLDNPLTHFALDRLRMRRVMNAALRRLSIIRALPGSGIQYRWRRLDSLLVADDIFGRGIYDAAIPPTVRTFADLGCNLGFFVARVADRTGRRDVRGLAVDADSEMVEETAWLLAANQLRNVVAVHGLVAGPDASGGARDFYLHPARVASSMYATDDGLGSSKKGPWVSTRVQPIDMDALWRTHFGVERCDLLKIDIEGAEADFVTEDNPFFERADSVVIEIHKWIIKPEIIEARLRKLGFEQIRCLCDMPTLKVNFCVRK